MANYPGLLTITLLSETGGNTPYDGIIDLHAKIKKQTIVLKSVHVLTTGTSLSMLYVDLPFLGSYNLIDGVSYMSRLPIYLDQTGVSTLYCPDIPLHLHNDIEPRFRMRVYNRDGSLATTGLVQISLQFSVAISSINV